MTWDEVLQAYRTEPIPLFDGDFIATHGQSAWQPTADDRLAAAKLRIQLVSRITTQRLPYLDGVEKTALASVYSLFEHTRAIADKYPAARHFDILAWHVLNTHVRPFTARWHRESERGTLDALDSTDHFRAELQSLQARLVCFDRLLLRLRDDAEPPAAVQADVSGAEDPIAEEMRAHLCWGIRPALSGIVNVTDSARNEQVDAINQAERNAIERRRALQGIKAQQTTGAAALAISGGGIRSATFALGVLIALAERGLLKQFDYLSTVSGGGYLGSFLSVFLQSSREDVGLDSGKLPFRRAEGEAAALRHLRHHSKYLAPRSAWERLKLLTAQLFGMALNGLAVAWILLVIVLVETWLRRDRQDSLPWRLLPLFWWVLPAAAVVWLLLFRLRVWRGRADDVIVWPAAALSVLAGWLGLGALHRYVGQAGQEWRLGDRMDWLALLGALPAMAPVLAALLPRVFARLRVAVTALSAVAAPLFVFALYLYIYSIYHTELATQGATGGGIWVWHGVWLAATGAIVYVLLFDINATSPHRHYRRKLGAAYLIQPKADSDTTFEQDVRVRLSELESDKAPYPLINCALNVPGSKDSSMQGRLTDFFLFSPAYCGSPLIGYAATQEWESVNRDLDIGTAMAISGAAASPQMGLLTRKRASFWLALLNVRLGYWIRRPKQGGWTLGRPGILYLVKEMLGWMHERAPFLNLSDGGHIENLGVYELLRRRCKFIVAIDGEQDASMTFHGLTTLQRLAAIDLGVQLDIDLEDLRLDDRGLSRSHFRFCRIRYPEGGRGSDDEFGYLLYVKLSLTGNEGEFLRRYRLDEPAFPHHSTADQFFDEAQFEAYRSLGEHIGNKLFQRAIVGPMADDLAVELKEWFEELGRALLRPTTRRRQ